jgi:hypothetical protein
MDLFIIPRLRKPGVAVREARQPGLARGDVTGVNPEVFQVVLPGPFSAEPDLLIARLILANAICQVFESDLRRIRSRCV